MSDHRNGMIDSQITQRPRAKNSTPMVNIVVGQGATPNIGTPFATWSILGTATNHWGAMPYLDSGALVNPRRFYGVEKVGP